jgi:hypothetical protein
MKIIKIIANNYQSKEKIQDQTYNLKKIKIN